MSASLDDLRAMIKHQAGDTATSLAREISRVESVAELIGALGSGRLGIQKIEEAERAWRLLVDEVIDELERFKRVTALPASTLIAIAREELDRFLPILRTVASSDVAPGSRYDAGAAARDMHELEWQKLPPYLDLKVRRWELGMNDAPQSGTQTITYSITADTISGPIQQGSHGSTQTMSVSADTLLTKLETTIKSEVTDTALQSELVALVRELHAKQGTPEFLGVYRRFMAAAADHMTVLAPFLPALSQLLPG